jgi:hypothetical protein
VAEITTKQAAAAAAVDGEAEGTAAADAAAAVAVAVAAAAQSPYRSGLELRCSALSTTRHSCSLHLRQRWRATADVQAPRSAQRVREEMCWWRVAVSLLRSECARILLRRMESARTCRSDVRGNRRAPPPCVRA